MPAKPKKKEVPAGIKRAIAGKRASADSEALLADLIEVWGGTRKLATDLWAEFQGAQKGGMTRQRIMEMIHRLIITNTTHEIGRVRSPSDMTDEELEDLALTYVKRVTTDGPSSARSQA